MELGESDKLLQEEKDAAAAEAENLRKKCRAAERAIEKAKEKRMAEFEAYALGKKESYDASIDEVEQLRKKYEGLMEQLSEAEDKSRQLNRKKVHESFAVTKLTPELRKKSQNMVCYKLYKKDNETYGEGSPIMVRNNIEVDVKVKCIEQGKTQAKLAEEIDTTKTYVNRVIKQNGSVVNNTFVKMMEALGYDIELTYVKRDSK